MSARQKKKLAQKAETKKLKRRMIGKVLSKSRTNNVAFNLNLLVDGWLELESDPGTFSLLIEDFGCLGAKVDEVYDLEQKFDGPVFGFIFLFKWLNSQQSDRLRGQQKLSSTSSLGGHSQNYSNEADRGEQESQDHGQWSYVEDENIISEMFFAKQMISNSCATHALISILLNCEYEQLKLGPTLTRLKEHTRIMDPENKGYAIGNLPELAKAHNSHASYSSLYNRDRPSSHSRGMSFMISGNQRTNLQQQNQHEAYHFVSYIPINNRLYELDGLKNYPIDHGPVGPGEDWTEKFRKVIKRRLLANKSGADDGAISNDIRYNLMAVVPDTRITLKNQHKKLKLHLDCVQESIRRMSKKALARQQTLDADTPTNLPFNQISNGIAATSGSGSSCGSPRILEENVPNTSQPDIDIPNPPYSPISNGTMTASETGSVCNSPRARMNELYQDLDWKVDKHFVIRFDSNQRTNETNSQDAATAPTVTNAIKEDKASILENMKALSTKLTNELEQNANLLKEETEKRRQYKIDNCRRTHNYEPFIMTFLSMLAKQGNLADLIEKDLGITSDGSAKLATTSATTNPNPTTSVRISNSPYKTYKTINNNSNQANNKMVTNGKSTMGIKNASQKTTTAQTPAKPKYKYVSTGRPRGRPRKYPLPVPQPQPQPQPPPPPADVAK